MLKFLALFGLIELPPKIDSKPILSLCNPKHRVWLENHPKGIVELNIGCSRVNGRRVYTNKQLHSVLTTYFGENNGN